MAHKVVVRWNMLLKNLKWSALELSQCLSGCKLEKYEKLVLLHWYLDLGWFELDPQREIYISFRYLLGISFKFPIMTTINLICPPFLGLSKRSSVENFVKRKVWKRGKWDNESFPSSQPRSQGFFHHLGERRPAPKRGKQPWERGCQAVQTNTLFL